MTANAPSDFHPQLTEPRLRQISETLLEVLYETELGMDTDLDDGYTRGTATFGRQRNAIIQLCQGGALPWLKLTNPAMDVTFEIEGIPCRFFADDPSNPRKPGYFRRNDSDKLFPTEVGRPEMFRFVVAKAQAANEETDVFFVGYDANLDEAFRWQYQKSTPVLSSLNPALPKEVAIEHPIVRVPDAASKGKSHQATGGTDEQA